MKKVLAASLVMGLFAAFTGCTSVEQNLQGANALLLSTKEVREVFQGNTVTSATGETFYWDANGTVVGKGAYGGSNKGNWNITEDGRLCVSNWNSSYAPSGCYKVYFDNTTQSRTLVDSNGDLKWTVVNVVTGNPNNF